MDLPANQLALLEAVAGGTPLIVVLANGSIGAVDVAGQVVRSWSAGCPARPPAARRRICSRAWRTLGQAGRDDPVRLEDIPSYLNSPAIPATSATARASSSVTAATKARPAGELPIRLRAFVHGLRDLRRPGRVTGSVAGGDLAVEVTAAVDQHRGSPEPKWCRSTCATSSRGDPAGPRMKGFGKVSWGPARADGDDRAGRARVRVLVDPAGVGGPSRPASSRSRSARRRATWWQRRRRRRRPVAGPATQTPTQPAGMARR